MFKEFFKGNTPIELFVNKIAIKLHLISNSMYKIPDYEVAPPIGGVEHREDDHPFPDPFVSSTTEKKLRNI